MHKQLRARENVDSLETIKIKAWLICSSEENNYLQYFTTTIFYVLVYNEYCMF